MPSALHLTFFPFFISLNALCSAPHYPHNHHDASRRQGCMHRVSMRLSSRADFRYATKSICMTQLKLFLSLVHRHAWAVSSTEHGTHLRSQCNASLRSRHMVTAISQAKACVLSVWLGQLTTSKPPLYITKYNTA